MAAENAGDPIVVRWVSGKAQDDAPARHLALVIVGVIPEEPCKEPALMMFGWAFRHFFVYRDVCGREARSSEITLPGLGSRKGLKDSDICIAHAASPLC